MSRAHAVAPALTGPSSLGFVRAKAVARKRRPRPSTAPDNGYLERALLLWPRLDRARLRKVAGDPRRIAEMVAGRTSQPFEVILAMLVRQNPSLAAPTEEPGTFEVRPETPRVALRIVRPEENGESQVRALLRI
jgi:hypothetical protein